MTPKIPITESSNPKSINLDLASSVEISRIISSCELEIFNGFDGSRGIFNPDLVNSCHLFIHRIQDQIRQHGQADIILVGSGTSGRLCRLMAQIISLQLKDKIKITPIIAGGIKALVRAQPNTEDKIESGIQDYLTYTANLDRSHCFVIGVSCGLSAKYVQGALDEANKYSSGRTAIIGFNPLSLATIDLNPKILLLNPIIGPEPVVGSVRMKGGTATMILLYTLLQTSLDSKNVSVSQIIRYFRQCQECLSEVHHYHQSVAKIIDSYQKTLINGGKIYLLGSSEYGALAIYDAAECPPTFGAEVYQVNGFTQKGIKDLVYFPGEEKEVFAKEVGLSVFFSSILPHLNPYDLIITLGVSLPNNKISNYHSLEQNLIDISSKYSQPFFRLLFVRSLLGQFSTGGFVQIGKVYQNKMIDLKITNKKLFFRAIRNISYITQLPETHVQQSLLAIIYENQPISTNSLEDHIALSATKEHLVPLTILSLVYPQKPLSELKTMLQHDPVVRRLILTEIKRSPAISPVYNSL